MGINNNELMDFIRALNFMNNKTGKEQAKIMDPETVRIYEIWYNIIYGECAKIITASEIGKIKKQVIEEAERKIQELESRRIIGFDSCLVGINEEEKKIIDGFKSTIDYIRNMNDKELIDAILRSIFISEENMEILYQEKSQMEHEKLGQLSYLGKKCVEDETINDELLKKIYKEIEDRGLNEISERVGKTLGTDKKFQNLNKTKINAEKIIIYEIYKIYEEKIEKIKKEIADELLKLSKSKYKDFTNTETMNLTRIIEILKEDEKKLSNKLRRIFNNIKKIGNKEATTEISEIISEMEETIKHIKKKEYYEKELDGFETDTDMQEIYNQTQVSKNINELKNNILSNAGVIINDITDDIISMYASKLKEELSKKVAVMNDQITEMCTQEEKEKIKIFAKKIGMTVENTLKFLRNDKSIYACLFTYLVGTEIQKNLNETTAPIFISNMDQTWEDKNRKLSQKITYDLKRGQRPLQQTNSKSLQEYKAYQKKLPYKK